MTYQMYRSTTIGVALQKKLRAYRFCDNVWTFMMENVEFRDAQRPIEGSIDRVKFVACDANVQKKGSLEKP
uniref:Transcription initiation factor IIA gamma subunit C-terminal domain-containing protein n=1 Tax=Meloidogyne javanica TaxID=6303 RepID=A0A915NAP5_MELJA